ncbi:DUF3124 domain-containing protein [Winogradskyella wichelsiae]|uniref:DUF3124 domain-containing protein n=1 Tax=Winogradskyella wichelsiae TaxID=2697007 RepID=UPI0015CC906E|nr:DUF3124 domain-containing protein [Winogradskyella wichelsiae]
MKKIIVLVFAFYSFYSCDHVSNDEEYEKINWKERIATRKASDSLEVGKSYLSVYSQIYSYSQHKTYNLTAMVSMRNTSATDSLYLFKVDYYDTHGELLKTYFDQPVFVRPMETLDIVINEVDIAGGTGGNFIFDWKTPIGASEPVFEGVMTSTSGQQGLSFVTQAKRLD